MSDPIQDRDDAERREIQRLLKSRLATEVRLRADSHEEVLSLVARLQASDGSLASRLVIGGFTLDPVNHHGIEQGCETCMYYKVHRRFCELPELNLAVDPEWSCRLWRI